MLVETIFLASGKQFFSICQIFLAVKTIFQSSGNVFFNEFFIPSSGNVFSVQWKQYSFIQRFAEAFEIRGQQLFLRETFFLFVETDFLAKFFFFFFIFQILLLVKATFCLEETLFLNEFFIPLVKLFETNYSLYILLIAVHPNI